MFLLARNPFLGHWIHWPWVWRARDIHRLFTLLCCSFLCSLSWSLGTASLQSGQRHKKRLQWVSCREKLIRAISLWLKHTKSNSVIYRATKGTWKKRFPPFVWAPKNCWFWSKVDVPKKYFFSSIIIMKTCTTTNKVESKSPEHERGHVTSQQTHKNLTKWICFWKIFNNVFFNFFKHYILMWNMQKRFFKKYCYKYCQNICFWHFDKIL